MEGMIRRWSALSAKNRLFRVIDLGLRGAGQVIFQNNPLTGLLFIVGIGWGAIAAGNIPVLAGGLLGLAASSATAVLLESDRETLEQGLFGFNGVLVGLALPTFIAAVPLMWLLLVVGAAVSTVAMLAISNIMKTWGLPALTFPFVLVTWFLLLSCYSFSHVPIAAMGPPVLARISAMPLEVSPGALLGALFKGPAQVFLIDNAVTGFVILTGLMVSSPKSAIFALAGSAVALFFAVLFGAPTGNIDAGLFAFSPVLTAVALGSVFYETSWRVSIFALLGTVFTVIVQGAMDAGMAPFGIPTLTAPFVLVTWLFLLPKADLRPHPHRPIAGGVLTGK